MRLYLYWLETQLNNTPNELEKIKFQSQEANTDEELKKYFQHFLLNNSHLDSYLDIDKLIYKNDNKEEVVTIEELRKFKIIDVALPQELSVEQKTTILNSKNSAYTSPDLFLTLSDGINCYSQTIELKSTKENTIPGSSIQQILPYEWVIFLKRSSNKVVVATGFYLHTITEKLPFPDRSPRPQIGFKTLQEWNEKHRNREDSHLVFEDTSHEDSVKLKILEDWQEYLVSQWLEIVLSAQKNKKEKWFNRAIRKFTLKFIEHSNNLSKEEYRQIELNLKKMIDKNET